MKHLKTYTGIGSRQTPPKILNIMTETARRLDVRGYVLRSGGAVGADTAFEAGADPRNCQIFLPWRRFNSHRSKLHSSNTDLPWSDAKAIAARTHPAWHKCSSPVAELMTRNVFQVLGPTLDQPSDFVICWTPDGEEVGGTAQALRLAKQYDIPVYNLGTPQGLKQLQAALKALS